MNILLIIKVIFLSSLSGNIGVPITLIIEFRMINMFWACSSISLNPQATKASSIKIES